MAGFSWDWKTKPSKKPKDDLDTYLSLVEKMNMIFPLASNIIYGIFGMKIG